MYDICINKLLYFILFKNAYKTIAFTHIRREKIAKTENILQYHIELHTILCSIRFITSVVTIVVVVVKGVNSGHGLFLGL